METNKGKEICNNQPYDNNESRNNNIYRPLKLQKLDIPTMATGQFQDSGASTSGGQPNNPVFYTTPAAENSRSHQENTNQEPGESNMYSEGPFFMYEDEVVGRNKAVSKQRIRKTLNNQTNS